MRNNRFINVWFALIVILLGVIAFRHDITPAYAAEASRYDFEVIRVNEYDLAAKITQETKAGWDPVIVSTWAPAYPAQSIVVFRKLK
jgi:hypothetical protein